MSFYRDEQFDKLSERWANVVIARERGAAKPKDVAAAFNEMTDYLDARFQSATEAAKATGTAGEPMSKAEIDAIVYKCRQNGNDTTYDIVNACLAARQPAPVVVKTWQERMADGRRVQNSEWCKDEEIAELRAALEARSQP